MKTAVLFSGGKDSCLALYYAMKTSEVKCLITLVSENPASYMFHTPNINLAEKQAEAIGLPLILEKTKGEKESELKDLERAIRKAKQKFGIEGVVTGALASVYQSSRVKKICDKLKLQCLNPLWQKDAEQHWKDAINLGFKTVVSAVSAEGLGREWLGKTINLESLEKLKSLSKKFSFHLGFEGGEAETLVIDGPIFNKRIMVLKAKKEWHGTSGTYAVEKVKLAEKPNNLKL